MPSVAGRIVAATQDYTGQSKSDQGFDRYANPDVLGQAGWPKIVQHDTDVMGRACRTRDGQLPVRVNIDPASLADQDLCCSRRPGCYFVALVQRHADSSVPVALDGGGKDMTVDTGEPAQGVRRFGMAGNAGAFSERFIKIVMGKY